MFLASLTSLKLTPGVTGTAKLTDGSLIFPVGVAMITLQLPAK